MIVGLGVSAKIIQLLKITGEHLISLVQVIIKKEMHTPTHIYPYAKHKIKILINYTLLKLRAPIHKKIILKKLTMKTKSRRYLHYISLKRTQNQITLKEIKLLVINTIKTGNF